MPSVGFEPTISAGERPWPLEPTAAILVIYLLHDDSKRKAPVTP